MLQWPLFYHAAFRVFYAAHDYECVRVNFFYFSIQPVKLQPSYNGVHNIHVGCFAVAAKPVFAAVYSYVFGQPNPQIHSSKRQSVLCPKRLLARMKNS